MLIECDVSGVQNDGRHLVALRGEVRQRLDSLLIHTTDLRGIGRSAFIGAAVAMFDCISERDRNAFIALAFDIEQGL